MKGSFPGIKLRNLFKLLLEQLTSPLTYVIEDEVLKITTVDKANEKLSIRMYPVGDLIMGPQQLQALAGRGGGTGGRGGSGGGGMGGGGMGGGGMGGGGMGGGGMGGGGMGGGGGMFSVPPAKGCRPQYHAASSAAGQRAQSSNGIAIPLAGKNLVAAGQDAFSERETVATLDRDNTRAGNLVVSAELRKEIAAHEILRQVAPDAGQDAAPPAGTRPPAGPPIPSAPAGQLTPRVGPPAESSVNRYRELMSVRGQQLNNEVTAAIQDNRRAGLTDPDSAIANLKRELDTVAVAGDIEPQVREELSRRLINTIQELRSVKEHQQINRLNAAEHAAQVEARRKSLEQMSLQERRLTELIDQVRALLVQAVHGDDNAYEQAEAVAREAIHLEPGQRPGHSGFVTTPRREAN